jgi:alpha-tubulin suppressor-like RCC1 family protein
VSAGDHFTCGVATGGEAYCWGWGGSNQLGNGEAVDRLEPTPVAGGLVFTSISAGSGYACGMANSGRAYCWGANGRGQLGTGDQQGRATPTLVGLQK